MNSKCVLCHTIRFVLSLKSTLWLFIHIFLLCFDFLFKREFKLWFWSFDIVAVDFIYKWCETLWFMWPLTRPIKGKITREFGEAKRRNLCEQQHVRLFWVPSFFSPKNDKMEMNQAFTETERPLWRGQAKRFHSPKHSHTQIQRKEYKRQSKRTRKIYDVCFASTIFIESVWTTAWKMILATAKMIPS